MWSVFLFDLDVSDIRQGVVLRDFGFKGMIQHVVVRRLCVLALGRGISIFVS